MLHYLNGLIDLTNMLRSDLQMHWTYFQLANSITVCQSSLASHLTADLRSVFKINPSLVRFAANSDLKSQHPQPTTTEKSRKQVAAIQIFLDGITGFNNMHIYLSNLSRDA